MSTEKKRFPEEAHELLSKFFNVTDANEISETLTKMLDAYIMRGDFDKIDLANTVSLVQKISSLAYNLEALKIRTPEIKIPEPIVN